MFKLHNAPRKHEYLATHRRKHLNLFIKTVYDDGPAGYPVGPMTIDMLDKMLITRDNHYYFCGPPGYMMGLKKGLLGWDVPEEQLHYEYFGPHDE